MTLFAYEAVPVEAQSRDASPTLRAGDAVRVQVSDEPPAGVADSLARVGALSDERLLRQGLSGEYVVGEDGAILVPLIGAVQVEGRRFAEVREELTAAYRRELAGQALRITALLRIPILGEVRQPGLYRVDSTYGIDELLALAGGLGEQADPGDIRVYRLDGSSLAPPAPSSPAADAFAFRSGDRLVVGRQSWLRQNTSALVGAAASVTAAAVTALLLR